ncbi:elongation factor G [Bifidobacterium eulemuris]|uniref:GTP-binding protein n=1 Tax=Bifidobacterium eulemuris TaxID=1765219 RepID=A0A261G781_9BIFI|nr:TetM/TetW/TetO/TetS family tetracycline resistance ribosomal protection protein [Bifidobacterium eulemuris]OZG67290.1 GTP-binding protein [Bifidobacterium eulemuris]QOL32874.1 TetM/TetW/TetO/TetS family tetracycline resistance ribosomal protection protein [Bifidobacterium eulemuris]
MKHIVAGLLAHVDAGKTTLSEALLYRTGEIRKLGRVDHGDAFLDTESLEKQRGITIHAHQTKVVHDDLELTLLDTPGHVDFAAETERVLRVLDYAILVVSGTDGVQGHTETLWRLLAQYHVPTFVFVNKMDSSGADRETTLAQLHRRCSDACLPLTAGMFGGAESSGSAGQDDESSVALLESIAEQDELALDEFLETGGISLGRIQTMIAERRLFPVFFGSALKLDGIDEFMTGLSRFAREPQWPAEFGARVFKIAHDQQHNRLTWLRVTGGTLKAKAMLSPATVASAASPQSASGQPDGGVAAQDERWHEKVDQLRVYNGAKFDIATELPAGSICAATGLTQTFPGEGLGFESDAESPALQPVLTYTVLPPGMKPDTETTSRRPAKPSASESSDEKSDSDGAGKTEEAAESQADAAQRKAAPKPAFDDLTLHKLLGALRELEDEEPLLHVAWVERLQEIHVQLMGAVQLEIIQQTLHDRFGLDVAFGPGGILYRETVTETAEGVGHFEPLRHYAEAHILLEPGEPGGGVSVASTVSENELDRNWQRLIMTHMREKEHLGVLTGSPLTDVRMTLVAGRAHLKHTEGGDFRQATYRAIRQGLMRLKERGACRVMEPWYRFRLEMPGEMVGRAMSDIQRMAGSFEPPMMDADYALLVGECPVSEMRDYAMEVHSYTHGRGRLSCVFAGYRPCHDEERVVAQSAYDPESDLENTPDSVFCAHGAGYPVKWYKVPDFMHLDWSVES